MPPRHVYWTIILEGKPTAFRAHSREELLPTLRQLQTKHPDAVLKWFARGKLWDSPEEERAASRRPRGGEARGRDWRPGGEHKDPRDRFKVPRDVRRQRFAAGQRRERFQRQGPGDRDRFREGERGRPGDARRRPGNRPPWNREGAPRGPRREWNPPGGPGRPDRPPGRDWNREERPPRAREDRRDWNREKRPARSREDRREWKPWESGFRKPTGPRPPRSEHPKGRPPDDRRPHGGRPPGQRPPRGRPPRGPGGGRKPGGGNKGGSGGGGR